MTNPLYEKSLAFHEKKPFGKLSVTPTKPISNTNDLALAYSPGVAGPVLKIAEDASAAYRYTGKGNLVAVISNGTAILGLGNRGALASKPVMEGKAALFKRFAGIDAFDIELDTTDPEEVIRTVKFLEPTFGGVNLEDIKAPECFRVETALIEIMNIPVFHDDQHGTAVVVAAGLLNALTIAGKEISRISVVLNGAGAAGVAVAHMLLNMGLKKEQLFLCDSKGVITTDRNETNPFKSQFARVTKNKTLGDALRGADVFIGVSKAGVLKPEMLQVMAKNPVVFAMANPDPEIDPALAQTTRPDVIIATGRSDSTNQINNLLCFPFIFRGALDTRSRKINDSMKLAAAKTIAKISQKETPPEIPEAYGVKSLSFGRDYFLPKPFDLRLLPEVASAVAEAAVSSGEARVTPLPENYRNKLEKLAVELANL